MRGLSFIVMMGLLSAAAVAGPGIIFTSFTLNGDAAGDEFGWSVRGAGDVNGDGFDDFIVGAYLNDTNGLNAGSARVFSGATGQVLYTFYGDSAGDKFGHSVSGAGDVNGDGFDDFIVGAPEDDDNGGNSGSARVFSGATGQILYTFYGDSIADSFGWRVSGAGDVNGDGFDDLIVGANGDDDNGTNSGSARVFSGATGQILYTFYGDSALDGLGYFVSGAGDVNGDGFDDVVVAAPFDGVNGANSGSVRVISGATGQVLYTFFGDSAGDNLGWQASGAGDVNGDGFDDIIVGARGDDDNGTDSGSVRVISGATGQTLYTIYGDSAGDRFGHSASIVGDVDGDGFDDFIVGAPGDDDNGQVLYTFYGARPGDEYGGSASGAGDVDGNGFADLIVGAAKNDNNGADSGSASVHLVYAPAMPTLPCPGDVNGDGQVTFADLNILLGNYNAVCPTP